MKILSGVETPDDGAEILINGKVYNHLTRKQAIDAGVSIIYQDLSLFPNLTVWENISFFENIDGLSAQYVMPSVLFGQEMLIIAAIALGGANLLGGFGTVSGTIMGVVIIRCITSGLTLLRVSSYWQDAILGFVILASIVIGAAKSVMCRRKKQ